jgi:hypothetical protein
LWVSKQEEGWDGGGRREGGGIILGIDLTFGQFDSLVDLADKEISEAVFVHLLPGHHGLFPQRFLNATTQLKQKSKTDF